MGKGKSVSDKEIAERIGKSRARARDIYLNATVKRNCHERHHEVNNG